ncbi:MAG: hypothetical protein JNK33_04525 [Candidatus Doudnabacteria bacterium]|nr:hypothetical protein [Candidatus Doudnabacteria bacterium]
MKTMLKSAMLAFTLIACLLLNSFSLAQTPVERRERAEETRQIHRDLTLPSGQPRPEPRRRKAPARKKTPPAKNRRR